MPSDPVGTMEDLLGPKWRWTIAGSVILVIVMAGLFYGTAQYYRDDLVSADEAARLVLLEERTERSAYKNEVVIEEQTLSEGGSDDIEVYVPAEIDDLRFINVSIGWEDEPAAGYLFTNQPDTFTVRIAPPEGSVGKPMESPATANAVGRRGVLTLSYEIDEGWGTEDWAGRWTVTILLSDCGDQTAILRTLADNANTYSGRIEIVYHATAPLQYDPLKGG